MNSNSHQENLELTSFADRVAQREIKAERVEALTLVFSDLIGSTIDLVETIRAYSNSNKPRGTNATLEKKAYRELVDSIPSSAFAEAIISAIFDPFVQPDYSENIPVTYQNVVAGGLINTRLRRLLPNEELAVPEKDKFMYIDMFVTRIIFAFPQWFINREPKKVKEQASIALTKEAWLRLGVVDTSFTVADVPMLCKPADWTSVFDGGYLTNEMRRGNPLISSAHHDYKELRAIDRSLQTSPDVLAAVNKMQGVSYSVDPNFSKYQAVIDKIRKEKIKALKARHEELKNSLADFTNEHDKNGI